MKIKYLTMSVLLLSSAVFAVQKTPMPQETQNTQTAIANVQKQLQQIEDGVNKQLQQQQTDNQKAIVQLQQQIQQQIAKLYQQIQQVQNNFVKQMNMLQQELNQLKTQQTSKAK